MKFINILFLFLHCFIVCIISLVSTYKDGGYKAQNKAHTSIILYKNIFNDTDIGCSSCAHTWKRKNSFIRSKKLTRNGKNNFRFSSCYNFLFIYTLKNFLIPKFPHTRIFKYHSYPLHCLLDIALETKKNIFLYYQRTLYVLLKAVW
jgi:hypothetical protein